MNCSEVRELLPDLAAGMSPDAPNVEAHISSCPACAAKLQGFHQTMALLDEWKIPEPSPYFDTRLQAEMRAELARPAAGWLHWFQRPVLGASLVVIMVAGTFGFSQRKLFFPDELTIRAQVPSGPIEPGTSLGDLQSLEKNHDLFADFDILDDLQVQDAVTANP